MNFPPRDFHIGEGEVGGGFQTACFANNSCWIATSCLLVTVLARELLGRIGTLPLPPVLTEL